MYLDGAGLRRLPVEAVIASFRDVPMYHDRWGTAYGAQSTGDLVDFGGCLIYIVPRMVFETQHQIGEVVR